MELWGYAADIWLSVQVWKNDWCLKEKGSCYPDSNWGVRPNPGSLHFSRSSLFWKLERCGGPGDVTCALLRNKTEVRTKVVPRDC